MALLLYWLLSKKRDGLEWRHPLDCCDYCLPAVLKIISEGNLKKKNIECQQLLITVKYTVYHKKSFNFVSSHAILYMYSVYCLHLGLEYTV